MLEHPEASVVEYPGSKPAFSRWTLNRKVEPFSLTSGWMQRAQGQQRHNESSTNHQGKRKA